MAEKKRRKQRVRLNPAIVESGRAVEKKMQSALAARVIDEINAELTPLMLKARKRNQKRRRQTLLRDVLFSRRDPYVYTGAGHDEMVYDLRMVGLNLEEITHILRISRSTLFEWIDRFPSFSEAWYRGGVDADAVIAKKLFIRAKGFRRHGEKVSFGPDGSVRRAKVVDYYPPDTTAAMFWLTNRQGSRWKSRTSTELSGVDGEPLQPPTIEFVGVVAAERPPDIEG